MIMYMCMCRKNSWTSYMRRQSGGQLQAPRKRRFLKDGIGSIACLNPQMCLGSSFNHSLYSSIILKSGFPHRENNSRERADLYHAYSVCWIIFIYITKKLVYASVSEKLASKKHSLRAISSFSILTRQFFEPTRLRTRP